MIVLDSHCDSPSQMVRLRDFRRDNDHAQVDFPKLKAGGVDASFFALYTPNRLAPAEAHAYALRLLDELDRQVWENGDQVAFARSAEEVEINKQKGLISILIGMENGSPLMGSVAEMEAFWKRGVRYITLCHNGDNDICDSCAGEGRWGGLSPFGRELVAAMNRQGMLIDIAHAADATVRDCLEYSAAPIVSTHSCCRALASHRRNLPDELIRGIAEKGGVVQVNFYPVFLSDEFARVLADSGLEERMDAEDRFIANPADPAARAAWNEVQDALLALPRPGVREIADHIDHVVRIGGIDAVGIGTDYDGIEVPPAGLETVARLPLLFGELRARGYDETALAKIAGGNFLRVLRKVQEKRG